MTNEEQKKVTKILNYELRLKAIHELRWILLGHVEIIKTLMFTLKEMNS